MQTGSRTPPVFSRREWLLLISLLLMVEAWVLNASYAFHGEQAVINYISFASTIASLLLAVLAIIYGFYQAEGQQKSAAALAAQVDAMHGIQTDLSETSAATRSQLAGLTSVTDSLRGITAVLGSIEGGVKTIGEQQKAVHEMVTTLSGKTQGAEVSKAPPPMESLMSGVFRNGSYAGDLLGVALYELGKTEKTTDVNAANFISKHYSKPLTDAKALGFTDLAWLAMGIAVLGTVKGLRLISWKGSGADSIFSISKEFLEALAPHAKAAAAAEGTSKGAKAIVDSFRTASEKE